MEALADIRVLDLSRLLPGPYASLILADLGARVDKLEEPQGEPARRMPPLMPDGSSALFFGLNRNKRSVVLDLKRSEGVGALKRLVRHYDVLLESFRPGVMERLGLSYEVLRRENPRLVYCALTGYGLTGPDRLKAGHDLNYIARAGALGYGGAKPDAPAMPGVQMADVGGGLFAVVGILAALHERARTGVGRLVDVSLAESATAFLHMHLAGRLALGAAGRPLERGVEALNGGLPSYNVYSTQDGRALAVGALEPKFFAPLCERLGHPEWVESAYAGGAAAAQVKADLADLFAQRTLAEWKAALQGLDACVEPVSEGDEVLMDPQHQARGLFVEDEAPGGKVTHLRTPLRFGPLRTDAPPKLGQHTREVLKEAGLTEAECAALGADSSHLG